MRLRLRIERNGLPPTQALWPVEDSKNTIAQLLQQLNEIFPLESETWGLEDYAVSVGGYECLHYHEVSAVCKEDDEVVITPLQYVDVRRRALAGRDQIAADGRHLVDGVPFGRPVVKAPTRPELRIPPRKKRRLSEDDAAIEGEQQLMLTEHGEKLEGDDDEDNESDDEDFEAEESEGGASLSEDDSSSEESSDGSDTSSSDSSSSDSDSGSSDTSGSDSSEAEAWDGMPDSAPPTPNRKIDENQLPNGVGESDHAEKQSSIGSKRKRGRDSDAIGQDRETKTFKKDPNLNRKGDEDEGTAEKASETPLPTKDANPPGQGSQGTKRRNIRRRNKKTLDYLKANEVLPRDATFETLRTLGEEEMSDLHQQARMNHVCTDEQRDTLLSALANGGVDIQDKQILAPETTGKDSRSKGSEANFVYEQTVKNTVDNDTAADAENNQQNQADEMSASATTRRSRLDLAGSKRLLFGSLGMRVPKTQEEKDHMQKRLAERPKKNAILNVAKTTDDKDVTAEPGAEEDPDAWKEKINLTAVECCDEGVTLSTPPFPFHQRWDPQYRNIKSRKRNSTAYMAGTGKKRKRGHVQETYDKYNVNGYSDALDYDGDGGDEEYWEDGALLDGEDESDASHGLSGRGESQQKDKDAGFPSLPDNLDEIEHMEEQDAHSGDVIAFTKLAVDQSTGWQPKFVTRTAKLMESQGMGETWNLQLAARDVESKVFDENGERVLDKYDMPGYDDGIGQDGTTNMTWEEMGTVRLLLRPNQELRVAE